MPADKDRLEYLEALGIDVYVERGQARGRADGPADERADNENHGQRELRGVAAASGDSAVALLDWSELRETVAACTRCPLHKGRTQTVFGVGNRTADWMVIGEAPGAEEDRRGEPFVGRAGHLLDEMLRAVGRDRDSVFIANILKCRPPNNRDPVAEEASACRGYLDRQIELLRPRLILAVGRIAAQQLLETDAPLGRLRGQVHVLRNAEIPVIVTYHPAYLLRSPTQKRKAWQDLCLARQVARKQAA